MTATTHAELVQRARRWLTNTVGCRLVLTEMRCFNISEEPDAIGWLGIQSYVVECKVSRSDFQADAKKFAARMNCRLGAHRFYLTPPGLLRPDEIPEPCGLLEVHGRRVRQIVRPLHWNRIAIQPPERNLRGEIAILISAAQGVSATMKRNFREMAGAQS